MVGFNEVKQLAEIVKRAALQVAIWMKRTSESIGYLDDFDENICDTAATRGHLYLDIY